MNYKLFASPSIALIHSTAALINLTALRSARAHKLEAPALQRLGEAMVPSPLPRVPAMAGHFS